MLFEFLGKTIVQPRRELFEKATGLLVSHSTSSGFLAKAESESAMATARQHDLIGTHIDAIRPNTFGGRGRGNGKNDGRGAKRGASRGSTRLRHLHPRRPLCRPLSHSSSSSSSVNNNNNKHNNSRPVGRLAAPSATPGRQQSTPLAHGRGRGRGKGQ